MSAPTVSVLLLTKDGMSWLPDLLHQIDVQQIEVPVETVAVDSGSTDGTAEFLESRVDRLVRISAESFAHGETRNLGVEHCRGELVVLLVQDALPASSRWLVELIAPLLEDSRVAGSFARQIVRADASAVTRYYHERWIAGSLQPRRIAFPSAEALERLEPIERHNACVFDNVCSCIRREVWQEHPFPAVTIGEDIAWGKQVLLAGHELVYAPKAAVIHSHDRSSLYELKRTALLHEQLLRLFELKTVPDAPSLARAVSSSLSTHLRCTLRGPRGAEPLHRELLRAIGLAFAWPLGQFLGARLAERGGTLGKLKGI